jgi:hypothetical protein
MKISSTFLFLRRQPLSWSKESKLVESIFPIEMMVNWFMLMEKRAWASLG